MRCLGRLVSDTKGVGFLPFENGGGFHIPLQCDRIADGLCELCQKRKARTDAKLVDMSGTSLQGTHPSYLHGLVTEPIPFWSHIYDGAWFRLKIAGGSIVREDVMKKAKDAAALLVEPPEPPKIPAKKGKKEPGPAEEKPRSVEEKPKPKFKLKKKITEPVATMVGEPVEPETILHIQVKKMEIDSRQVYIDMSTQKVYDLKCKYLGRHDPEKGIVPFPDSDQD